MKKKYFKNSIVFIVALIFLPMRGFAMQFFFEAKDPLYGKNDTVHINVLLDTEGQLVNTVSGTIQLGGITSPKVTIIDGNSSVLFWIEKPTFNQEENIIQFSGITPGGISGPEVYLMSLEISGQEVDDIIKLSTKNTEVLLHDGLGTSKIVSSTSKNIFISEDPNFSQAKEEFVDEESPEDFVPVIAQDENLYDGKVVLVFATQDKGSGIDRFEIKEGYLGKFIEGESPYLLKDQKFFKTLFVKATDGEGNTRISVVHPQEKIFDQDFILIFSILIVLGIITTIMYRKKRRS